MLLLLASTLISSAFASQKQEISFDNFGRLTNYPGKVETICPNQHPKMAVLFIIGQSNSANYAEKKYSTKYPTKVFNYFNGKCFAAASPLLGATGTLGEFITPLADKLIDNGDYESVVIISTGIGGTAIGRWQKGGDLNSMMLSVLAEARKKFKVTEIIWHQGESDFIDKTSPEKYTESFNSLVKSIRSPGIYTPPIYYAIATKCGENPNWTINNPIAKAQRFLSNATAGIYLAADTDNLLLDKDRRADHCHFAEEGQLKTADAFAKAIHQHKII